jgi:hypothetical protein
MDVDDSGAAIVCSHVAAGAPIMGAYRDTPDPEFPEDSGWQFTCLKDHRSDRGKVWSLRDVSKVDSTVVPFFDDPPGTRIHRTSPNAPWRRIGKHSAS